MATAIILAVLGTAVGFALGYFYMKSGTGTAVTVANEKVRQLEAALAELKNELKLTRDNGSAKLEEERGRADGLNALLASAKTENEGLKQKLGEQKGELEQLNQKFTKEFELLANRILDEKSHKFTEQNRTNLDIILNPFKEKLKDFEKKVDDTYKSEMVERASLKGEIKNLIDLNKQISEEANNLATALKGDNKQQGNWGELVLERIMERSGLKKDEEYKTQQTTVNSNGEKIKPDVVVFLPDNKNIIIDSKVSLVAYEACVNATDETERMKFLKAHIESLRSHIKLLSDKNYQTGEGYTSPDFVLLFVPIESSFSLAVQGDGEIFNFAWDRKIVIVSPSTLLATLRTIASIWKQEKLARNHLQIADEAGKLYDKFVLFYEDLKDVGDKMNKATDSYRGAMSKLVDGSGNLVKRVEKMRELGAKATKELPQNLIERANG